MLLYLGISALLLLMILFSKLLAYALENYSVSRLEELCEEHQDEMTFGCVMKSDQQLLRIWDLLSLVAVFGYVCWIITYEHKEVFSHSTYYLIISYLPSILVLIFCSRMLPWCLSMVMAEEVLLYTWPLQSLVLKLCYPYILLMQYLETFSLRVAGRDEEEEDEATNLTEDIRSVIDEGQREGVIEQQASNMIHRVIQLSQEDVSSVMTPRIDIISLKNTTTIDEARKLFIDLGHSRVPIYDQSPDDIIGILYAKDLLKYLQEEQGTKLVSDIIREPLYIPESTGIHKLLETMKASRVHIAIVLDEYGGVAGLVTMEDILEEIVGDIADEYDPEHIERIKTVQPGLLEVDARVHLDELNDQFDLEFPEDGDFDTVGGFIIHTLGRIPREHDSITVDGTTLTVIEADQRKVSKVRISLPRQIPAPVENTGT
jgi:CBS domain containing-hemolysin-like protein